MTYYWTIPLAWIVLILIAAEAEHLYQQRQTKRQETRRHGRNHRR